MTDAKVHDGNKKYKHSTPPLAVIETQPPAGSYWNSTPPLAVSSLLQTCLYSRTASSSRPGQSPSHPTHSSHCPLPPSALTPSSCEGVGVWGCGYQNQLMTHSLFDRLVISATSYAIWMSLTGASGRASLCVCVCVCVWVGEWVWMYMWGEGLTVDVAWGPLYGWGEGSTESSPYGWTGGDKERVNQLTHPHTLTPTYIVTL